MKRNAEIFSRPTPLWLTLCIWLGVVLSGTVYAEQAVGNGPAGVVRLSPSSQQTGSINVSGAITTGGAITASGTVLVKGANIQSAGTGTYSTPTYTVVAGDAIFQQSATCGAMVLGGATSNGTLDFGCTHSNAFTTAGYGTGSGDLYLGSTGNRDLYARTITGATLVGDGTSITKVSHTYNSADGSINSTYLCQTGTFTAAGTTQAVTFNPAFSTSPTQESLINNTAGTNGAASVTGVSTSGLTFAVVSTNVYHWQVCGY